MTEGRKLAAILAADVVGYSRLAGVDEELILARLRTLRSDLIDPTIAVHNGRIVKRTGDGILVEFRSVVDAVRCAMEVQNGLTERNSGVPPERQIKFRIGIHVGDIVEEADGDLMGDGVNIAARLEGICDADLGPQSLKNIVEPVRAYLLRQGVPAVVKSPKAATRRWRSIFAIAAVFAVVLLAVGGYAWRAGFPPRLFGTPIAEDKLKTAPRFSIVVLPFENLSGDPDQEYFADGITDDLTTDLSQVPGSFVIARNTAFIYKGKPIDAKAIGRELGVRYVLEGSVRRLGETVEVNAQLISTETGAHVWADQFQGERSNLGKLQLEVVARLANSLGVELLNAEALRSERERADNPNAVDLTLRGLAKIRDWNNANKSSWNDAIAMLERALALDPRTEMAMTGLALALQARVSAGWSDDPSSDLVRAEKAADAALELRPHDAWALMAKAWIFEHKKEFRSAIAEAEAARAGDPNNADAIAYAGFWKMYLGHSEDGVSDIETALRLSPHDPNAPMWQLHLCLLHLHLAHWEQTIDWCEKALANNVRERATALASLAVAFAWTGRVKEAKDAVAELRRADPSFTVQTWAGLHESDDPTYNAQGARTIEGLRKAGVPEGPANTN